VKGLELGTREQMMEFHIFFVAMGARRRREEIAAE